MELGGVAALVTGGASGLGAATARRLHSLGARVAVVDRDADRGQALAGELGEGAAFVAADVADEQAMGVAVEQAASLGPLRVAVACAGIGEARRVLERDGRPHPLASFERVLRVNLVGTFNALRLAAAAMARLDPLEGGQRGVVVATASIAAYEGQIGQVAYSASKAGIVGMTLPAARDLASVGVRVLAVAPGIMDTPLLGQLPEDARQALGRGVPFPKRMGTPEEFASLVVHLCENDYLNGEVVRLDGGLRMPPR
jgi:NAD(P)-dependent dehydrogenase (short-subunit alcohol dehydrogenase family)